MDLQLTIWPHAICHMAWRFCLPHQRALWYTHVNSGSLPCPPRCGDPLYHMLESPTFPSTVLSTLWASGVSQKNMDLQLTIQEETPNKPLRLRWVPSHIP